MKCPKCGDDWIHFLALWSGYSAAEVGCQNCGYQGTTAEFSCADSLVAAQCGDTPDIWGYAGDG